MRVLLCRTLRLVCRADNGVRHWNGPGERQEGTCSASLELERTVALALTTALVSGCGGSASSGAEGEKSVKIGIGAPLTAGSVAQGQGIEGGGELAVKEANEREELKALKPGSASVPGDDQGDPKTGVTVANTFVGPRRVAVVGHLDSGVTIPASKVYSDAKVAVISPAATDPALALQGLENVLPRLHGRLGPGPRPARRAACDEVGARPQGRRLDDSTPYGEGLARRVRQAFAASGRRP